MSLNQFITYLTTEKRYSAHSIKAYQSDIHQFEAFLVLDYEEDDLNKATGPMIRSWVVSLKEKGMANKSLNRKLTSLKSYYTYCVGQGMLASNPAKKIQSLKTPRRLPVFATKENMVKNNEQVMANDFSTLRNSLVIEMLYQTGMRLSELIGLKEEHIDRNGQTIKVTGKGNKQRIIPFHQELRLSIGQYLAAKHRQFGSDEKCLFVTDKGKPAYAKLIYRIVFAYLRKNTTLDKTSPHVLRHTFATHLLNNGASILAIKELLGHSSLAATQIYTHSTIEQLKQIHQQAHPKG
ncbi:MAG: tyrosine-type recombinase/integrase [Bacteroidetes bacterium]|nr:tyrosine-type recombinase/integrase [Bacteroidota bacterium]